MAIQALTNHNAIVSFGFVNPVQNLGSLAITMFAMHIISNLPGAAAKEAQSAEKQLCEIACEPLPGGKDDAPERICVETCEKGAEIIKTTTKETMKDGNRKSVEVLGKVVTPVAGYFDCDSICSNPITAGGRVAGDLFKAGINYFWKKDVAGASTDLVSAAAKTGCIALLATPAGYPGCLACCGGTKYLEI